MDSLEKTRAARSLESRCRGMVKHHLRKGFATSKGHFILYHHPQSHDVADITSDTVLGVLEALDRGEYDSRRIRSLIYYVARDRIIDFVRQQCAAHASCDPDCWPDSGEDEPLPRCFLDMAGPDLARTCLALSKGLPKKETARRLGVSEKTIHAHCKRLRERLGLFDPSLESADRERMNRERWAELATR